MIIVEPKTPWKLNAKELAKKNSHEVSFEVIHKRIKKYQHAPGLYYAWFLSPADSSSLLDRAKDLFKNLYEKCPEFKTSFAKFSSMLNLKSAMSYYNRDYCDDNILHCTAKFLGFAKGKNLSDSKDYCSRIEEYLGQVQDLKVIGYYFSEHTFGARIELSEKQLKLYDQDESYSSWEKRQFARPGQVPKSSGQNIENDDLTKNFVSLKDVSLDHIPKDRKFNPISAGNGRRAHITLGTAKNARPVNTGIDLLDITLAEKNCCEAFDKPLFESAVENLGAIVRQYKPNFWVVYPEEGVTVEALFTSYY